VPFILVSDDPKIKELKLNPGIHANIAPTILNLLEIPVPPEMDQPSLLIFPQAD
jgi:2,3-bisphosphoglycerate-independent phosphoglycerate mutase